MTYRPSRSLPFAPLAAASAGLVALALGACGDDSPGSGPLVGPDGGAALPDGALVGEGGTLPSTCAPPTGEGTKHSARLGSDTETWTAEDSPHVVDFSVTIGENQTLTIAPCAVVRLVAKQGLYVRGKLHAEGVAGSPVTIQGDGAEPWSTIEASATSQVRLVHTTVEGGGFANGGRPEEFGMIDVRGNQDDPTQGRLHADHLLAKGSASLGVWLREGGGFSAESRDVSVTGGAAVPVKTWARAAGTLPTGTYTGNATDEIVLEGAGSRDAVVEDATLKNLGVPYRVHAGQLNVGRGTHPAKTTLTIEAGVTLRFPKDGRMLMAAERSDAPGKGVLRALGTAAAPVVFTSTSPEPSPGDWGGLQFEGAPDANTTIDHARIEYAGGSSGISSYDCPSPANPGFTNQGAIVVYGGQPSGAFLTNSAIVASGGDGVVRGWTGDVIDFLPTNTFTSVAQCHQTYPKPREGSCPNPAPCPR